MINLETEDELLIKDINEVNLHTDTKYEYNQRYQTHNLLKDNRTMEVNFNCNDVDMNKILGLDISKFPDQYDIQIPKPVQKRKHKKKRINKKWMKRYGYTMVQVVANGFEVK